MGQIGVFCGLLSCSSHAFTHVTDTKLVRPRSDAIAEPTMKLAVLCFFILEAVMSFDSVDILTESDPEVEPGPPSSTRASDGHGGLKRLASQPSGSSKVESLPSVDALTDDDGDFLLEKNPASDSRKRSRVNKKRQREESKNRNKKQLADVKSLKSLLLKACRNNCKSGCLNKFRVKSRFEELFEFRKEWVELHKLDQDTLLFERMKEILLRPDDAEVVTQWVILGVNVCLKAWKRLHGVGTAVVFRTFCSCVNQAMTISIQLLLISRNARTPQHGSFEWIEISR